MNTSRIRELMVRVPRPPGEALPPGISDAELERFSRRTAIDIPADLAEWLKVSNGPCIGPGGFFGIHTARSNLEIENYLALFPEWVSRRWIPIAGDGCGNYYVLSASTGKSAPVYFIDTSVGIGSPTFVAASDLEHFIGFILKKELRETRWPFDKDAVLAEDPNIGTLEGLPFPWQVA